METPSTENDKKNGRRLLTGGRLFGIIAAVIVCAVSIGVMIYALTTTGGKTEEFTPPPFESTAVKGTPDVPENLGWEEIDGKSYLFSVCGVLIPKDGKADVWLTNPENNHIWMKIRILNESGDELGETGLIRPGEYVQSVPLDILPADGDNVTMKIMAYEPETYYSAGVVNLNTTVKGDDAP